MERSVQQELEEWGKWERQGGGTKTGYNRLQIGLGSTVQAALMTDDRALAINAIVARLSHRRPEMGQTVFFHYVRNWPDRRIAERLEVSKSTAQGIRRAAEAWIDAKLDALENA